MNFDPFGDFDTRGYLRNFQKLKEPAEIKRLEHRHFLKNLNRAAANLEHKKQLSYQDVLDTHKILFGGVYPWAGEDRATTAPDIAVAKGGLTDLFTHPQDCQRAIDQALKLGQNRDCMAECPGAVMGYLAHGHPFLDGNGRTIMVVHNELAHRADISIDWGRIDKKPYLEALTRELTHPERGELDKFLKPYLDRAVSRETMTQELGKLPGLGPDRDDNR